MTTDVNASTDTTSDAKQADDASVTDAKGTDGKSDKDAPDLAVEAAKWQALARKHEDRAKANANAAKELDELRKATMNDQEKAVADAVAKATGDTLVKVGSRLVDAEVKVAFAGRNVDIEAVLEGLDRSRFLSDDGEPKVDDIAAWADRIAPKPDPNAPPPPRPPVDMGQGARQTIIAGQITDRAALQNMTQKQISDARRDGRLDALLSGKT